MSCKRTRDDREQAIFDEWSTRTPDAFSLHTQFCWNSKQSKKLHVMPWDLKLKSPMMVQSESFSMPTWKCRMPSMPCLPDEQTAVIESEMVEDAFTKVGLRAASASDQRLWQEKLSWERKCACEKWCTLVLMKLSAWAIGRSVASSSGMQLARGSLMESVVDALAGKATATLHGRAGPLLKYAKFWRDRGLDFFPVQEDMVYQYIKAQSNWAPTAPRSLLISLSFAFHILGLSGGDVASKSGRIKGVSDAHYADRRKLVQRPPLTADQILMREKTVHDTARTSYDRIASGFFLVLIYGRLRYSDGLQLVDSQLDIKETEFGITGFLEARAERTKTSVTLERKIRFLPVAIPVEALMDDSWIPVWLELRQQAGLHGGQPFPMLPSPQLGGGWARMPLTVSAAADWLRSLLKVESSARDRLATHSCKATMLSMAAKFGLDHGTRRLLGYHSEGRDRSMLTYSRDAISAPLRKMVAMIKAVKDGKFFPDSTRSGYFVPDDIPAEASVQAQDDDTESDTSSSRGSASEEDANPDEEETAVSELVGKWAPTGAEREGQQYARHRVSRCIHSISDESGLTFTCGRSVNNRYIILLTKPSFMHPICSGCFRT